MLRFSSLTIIATIMAVVNAHGSMSNPKPVFQDIYNRNAPSSSAPMAAGPYNGNDVLKDLAERNGGARCGKTDGNAPVLPIPADGMVKFDISARHIGPCEIWLDNERVVFEKDCWTKYSNYQIPVDFSKCKSGKCQLRWIWLATHNSPGEVYDNCVNVGGGGGGNDNNNPVTPSMSPAPAPAPAPAPEGDDTYPEEPDQEPEPAPEGDDSYPSGDDSYPERDDSGNVEPLNDNDSNGNASYTGKNGATAEWCAANCARGFCPEAFCEKGGAGQSESQPNANGGAAYRGKNGATAEWCAANCARGFCPEGFCEMALAKTVKYQ